MSESLRIEAPTGPLARSLIERLDGFRSELVPVDGRFQVQVDIAGRDGDGDRALLDSLDHIESWLESSGLTLAEIHLDGRSYRLERHDGPEPPPPAVHELEGLICRVRTIPLGAGVQVVSVEGKLDLDTSPKLEEALQSTVCPRVVVDLTEVPFVDSTALGVIVAATKRMQEENRRLAVASGNPTVARVFTITGLEWTLDVHRSLQDAIAAALDGVVGAENGDGRETR